MTYQYNAGSTTALSFFVTQNFEKEKTKEKYTFSFTA